MKKIREYLNVKIETLEELKFLMENCEHDMLEEIPNYFCAWKGSTSGFYENPSDSAVTLTFAEFKKKYFPEPRTFYLNVYPDGHMYVYDGEEIADIGIHPDEFERIVVREVLK